MKSVQDLLNKHPTRVAHNSLLVLFALGILPYDHPNPIVCTRATMWALPEVSSTLFMAQYSSDVINQVIKRVILFFFNFKFLTISYIFQTEIIFDSLKAHLKRAPSLKGAALVKLSALKLQTKPWPEFSNFTLAANELDDLDIGFDNWFENILRIYKKNKIIPDDDLDTETHIA